jgi:hypothetical protein
MAKVNLQIKVSSVNQNAQWAGRVIQGWESYNSEMNGQRYTRKRFWSVFFELPTNINKDDLIEVTGDLQTKSDGTSSEYEGKTYFKVEHTVGNASFKLIEAAVPLNSNPANDGWNTPPTTELNQNPPF